MIYILAFGALIAIINVILTFQELMPFLKAITQLHTYTKLNPSFANYFWYPVRFISILPKAMPLVLDTTIAIVCGSIGLGGGVYGALIGITIGFTASLLVKFYRRYISPKIKTANTVSWKYTEPVRTARP